ncbi:ftsJ-like methyltransferase family protein [Tasmannia lanceolata]|uniref:ftsJ-like methyltransferase family protein n=1 Tax=Tasmannia lanceolata TaxID=3420 RepID=UPI0040632069
MGKAKLKGKNRLDKFYHLAKEQGYRSRASFKLLQLDAKFRFLPSSRSVLDLCAAPGGWMQVAVRHVPVGSFVLGVDLFPIRPIRGAVSIEEDITTQKCKSSIRRLMDENGCRAFDVVLHDGSPNVGGAWAQEATTQASLVIDAVKLSVDFLAPKGTFVTKVFRSQDYSAILYCLKQLFDKVEVTKPVASRSTSAEIYVIGLRYKAPAKVDPRLLDVKHLFQGAIEPPKVLDVLRGTKQKRNREGYEDGNTTLRKVCVASDFVWSETPLEILGSVTSISFEDPACLSIKDHTLTTEEIKALCDDLRVLGKQDFKHLLKWRMQIRKALTPVQQVVSKANDVEEGTKDDKGDEDDRILNEMEELTSAMERKKKQAKKLMSKRRAKDKARKATGMQIDAMEDGYTDHELFSLSAIKGKKELLAVDSTELNDENDNFRDSESEENPVDQEDSTSDLDSDEEQRRYDDQLEEFLDQAYERFVTRKGGSIKQRKRAKQVLYNDGGELLKEDDEVDGVRSDHDSDKDDVDNEANPLLVPLHEENPTQEQIAEQWFSQDIFAEAAEEGAFGKKDSEDEREEEVREKKLAIPKKPKGSKTLSQDKNPPQTRVSQLEDFEIVPAEATDTSDDDSLSSDESEIDDNAKAEILAYAKKMLRKKQREQILDDAYNKYMFDDEGLPTWFVEEEKRHFQPIKPVTKEEVAAMKAQFREIDARPAKKVAQAKARKKRSAMKKLEKVRQKANTISDQTDISDRSKNKMIDRLYKKAIPKKPQKEYVVAKKGVQVRGGKGKVVVDRRMKKDARSRGMGKPGKGGSHKGKNAKGKPAKGGQRGKGSSMGGKGSAKGGKGSAKAPGRKGSKGNKGRKMNMGD